MKNLLFIFALLLLIAPAQAAYNDKPDVSRAVGQLPVANGGTGATSLGTGLTNSGSVLNNTQCVGRTVTMTTDTIVAADRGCPVRYNSASPVAVGIAAASSTGLTAGFGVFVYNDGTANATITPTTSTIEGAATLVIPPKTGCDIYSDGTNYKVHRSSCSAFSLSLDTLPANMIKRSIGVTVDGGGSPITTGVKGYYRIPFNATITGWSLQSDIDGAVVVDVWKAPNDTPLLADSITAGAKPSLSSADYVYSTTLTGWNVTVNAGDVIAYNIDSASTMTRVTFQLYLNVRE